MKHFAGHVFLRPLTNLSTLLVGFLLVGQNIPVGTWRTHFSYNNVKLIEQTRDKVFAASENGLFSIDLEDGATRKLSKIDGLSDVGVSTMRYNSDLNMLAIGYRSGWIDLIFEDELVSVGEIANSSLIGDKQINEIGFFGDQTYAASGLGIVVLNSISGDVKENFIQIGIAGADAIASELVVLGSEIFIKTEEGIQRGNLSTNLLDFNNWTRYTGSSDIEDLEIADGKLYGRSGSDLYQFIDNIWVDLSISLPVNSFGLFVADDRLHSATGQSIYAFDGAMFQSTEAISATDVNDITFVSGEYWIGDSQTGLINEAGNQLSPSGPIDDQFSRIRLINQEVFGFHAPNAVLYDGTIQEDGYSLFSNGSWSIGTINNFQNISDVAVFEGERYLSSIGDGIFVESDNQILTDIPGSHASLDTTITALATKNGLWASSFDNENPIHRLDGTDWSSFTSTQLFNRAIVDLKFSQTGILWGLGSDGTVAVFDIDEEQSDLFSGELPGSASAIDISIEDDVWVATTNGPANFEDASFIFLNSSVTLPSFEGRTLFEDEVVNTVITDGGNRVWFGTSRGLWVFDENISTQETLFNFENSPLPSNNILDLAYNSSNGEMFIVTDKGMVSYRSASSRGTVTHSDVNIFPNPVRPDYNGQVGIDGLANNVSVKITDVNGNLVKEVKANGGSASWDLRNVLNQEVQTGIYLLFSSTNDGEETYVGKMAVIR